MPPRRSLVKYACNPDDYCLNCLQKIRTSRPIPQSTEVKPSPLVCQAWMRFHMVFWTRLISIWRGAGANCHRAARTHFPAGLRCNPVPTPYAATSVASMVPRKRGYRCVLWTENQRLAPRLDTPKRPNYRPAPWRTRLPTAHAASGPKHSPTCCDA